MVLSLLFQCKVPRLERLFERLGLRAFFVLRLHARLPVEPVLQPEQLPHHPSAELDVEARFGREVHNQLLVLAARRLPRRRTVRVLRLPVRRHRPRRPNPRPEIVTVVRLLVVRVRLLPHLERRIALVLGLDAERRLDQALARRRRGHRAPLPVHVHAAATADLPRHGGQGAARARRQHGVQRAAVAPQLRGRGRARVRRLQRGEGRGVGDGDQQQVQRRGRGEARQGAGGRERPARGGDVRVGRDGRDQVRRQRRVRQAEEALVRARRRRAPAPLAAAPVAVGVRSVRRGARTLGEVRGGGEQGRGGRVGRERAALRRGRVEAEGVEPPGLGRGVGRGDGQEARDAPRRAAGIRGRVEEGLALVEGGDRRAEVVARLHGGAQLCDAVLSGPLVLGGRVNAGAAGDAGRPCARDQDVSVADAAQRLGVALGVEGQIAVLGKARDAGIEAPAQGDDADAFRGLGGPALAEVEEVAADFAIRRLESIDDGLWKWVGAHCEVGRKGVWKISGEEGRDGGVILRGRRLGVRKEVAYGDGKGELRLGMDLGKFIECEGKLAPDGANDCAIRMSASDHAGCVSKAF